MAAASLVVRVSAQIAEFQKSFNDATKVAQKFSQDFEGIATRASAVGSFIGNVAANIASSLARAFGQGIADAVRLSSEFSNAFIGLGSVARAFGTDADAASAAARRLSADGLLPLKDSATGLKNLLATGFNLDQATRLMDAFKDSAAFGRAGALSFGDAVRTATEGVKNGNSILVDNAGITKNLSQILKEAGYSAQDLSKASSDVGVRMALFNGILKESTAFMGDANRLTQTYSGTLTAMQTQWKNLLATWGDAITQNKVVQQALGFTAEAFSKLAVFLSDNQRGMTLVSDAVIGFVSVLAAGVRAINAMQQAFNFLDTVIIGTVKVFTDAAKIIAETAISVATLASKLPGSTFALAVFKEELAGAFIIADEAAKASDRLGARMAANAKRSTEWSEALGGFAGSLDSLKTRLEASRGQMVSFGNAGDTAGRAVGQSIEAGSNKAGAALTTLQKKAKETHDSLKLLTIPFTISFETGDIPFIEPSSLRSALTDRLQSVPLDLSAINAQTAIKQFNEGLIEAIDASDIRSTWKKLLSPDERDTSAWMAELHHLGLSVAESIGRGIATGDWASVGKELTANLSRYIGDVVGNFVNAFVPGLGTLLAPIFGGIAGAIGGLFDRNKGRDLVEDFAGTFGGFDTLHRKLGELGADGEQLWIRLTQGVGRNNPEQARAAIEAVNAAFASQGSAAAKAAAAVESSSRKLIDSQDAATSSLKTRISELGSEYDRLFQSIANEAPEEVMGVIEQQTRARMESVRAEQVETQSALDAVLKKIEESFAGVAAAATGAAQSISDAFTGIRIPPIRVPFTYDEDRTPDGIPALGRGGIVRRPTLALIGESGPEAVIPLSQSGFGAPSQGMATFIFETDGQTTAEIIAPYLPGAARRYVGA